MAAVHQHGTDPKRPLSFRRLRELVGCQNNRLTEATKRLHEAGRIVRTPDGRCLRFTPPGPPTLTLTEGGAS